MSVDSELARLSRWRLLLFCTWVALLPVEMTLGIWLSDRLRSPWPFLIIPGVIAGIAVFAIVRINLFDCPRCHKRFTSKPMFGPFRYSDPTTSRCLHCGLTRSRG